MGAMILPLMIPASGLFCVAAVVGFVLTRRYGPGLAILAPLIALIAMAGIMYQADGGGIAAGLGIAGWSLAASTPILLGMGLGVLLARRKPD